MLVMVLVLLLVFKSNISVENACQDVTFNDIAPVGLQ